MSTAPQADDLLEWREEFPILEKSTYLISNSLGAMPRGVFQSLEHYAHSWNTRGVRAWEEGWWGLPARVGEKVGLLLGAEPGSISLHQNVTLAQAVIASCFDFESPRNKIVMVDMEFPSVLYFYRELERRGASISIVASDDGIGVDTQKLLEAIDEHTLLVPISYVLFRSSFIQDVQAIVERAHQVGAMVVLDCFQAAGTVPIHLGRMQVDFAVGGVLKWLCGGPGVAYLYVRPDLQRRLRPMITGWMAHRRPFAFENGPMDLSEDGFRFLNGTPHVPSLHACLPGMEILTQAGISRIREKSTRQTRRLMEGAQSRGWRVNTPEKPESRGGTVCVDCPQAEEVCRELLAREILVDFRPQAGVRISPHFYTRDEETDYALEQIEEILSSGAWKKHCNPGT